MLKVEALSQPRMAGKVSSRQGQPDRALSSKQYIRKVEFIGRKNGLGGPGKGVSHVGKEQQ